MQHNCADTVDANASNMFVAAWATLGPDRVGGWGATGGRGGGLGGRADVLKDSEQGCCGREKEYQQFTIK